VKWRVWSWLRMNASNMLYTCKLNARPYLDGVANGWVMDRNMLCGRKFRMVARFASRQISGCPLDAVSLRPQNWPV